MQPKIGTIRLQKPDGIFKISFDYKTDIITHHTTTYVHVYLNGLELFKLWQSGVGISEDEFAKSFTDLFEIMISEISKYLYAFRSSVSLFKNDVDYLNKAYGLMMEDYFRE